MLKYHAREWWGSWENISHTDLSFGVMLQSKKRRDFLERRISRFSIIKHITKTAPSVWRLPRKFYPKKICERFHTQKKNITKILSYTHSAYREAEWKKISSLQFSTIFVFVSFFFSSLSSLAGWLWYILELSSSERFRERSKYSILFIFDCYVVQTFCFFFNNPKSLLIPFERVWNGSTMTGSKWHKNKKIKSCKDLWS